MMNSGNFQVRKQKWEKKRDNRADSARQATFTLTVKNALEFLKDKKGGKILDIGCGSGEIDILLAKYTNFDIVGCDISESALKSAKANVEKAGLSKRITIEQGDVYGLKYADSSFDAVVSFGYASAATYRGAQKEIARVLKPGGLLICDFINCPSFYKLFSSFKRLIKGNSPYYFLLSGIKKEFEKSNFIFKGQKLFNAYPPLNLNFSPQVFLIFENTLGRLFKRGLARVRLVCFSSTRK